MGTEPRREFQRWLRRKKAAQVGAAFAFSRGWHRSHGTRPYKQRPVSVQPRTAPTFRATAVLWPSAVYARNGPRPQGLTVTRRRLEQRPIFLVRLRPEKDIDGVRSLRLALKFFAAPLSFALRELRRRPGPAMNTAPLRHQHLCLDPVAVFTLRCWARAELYTACEFDLAEAVDVLQRDAERDGLVAALGQDYVQRIMADAFAKVRHDVLMRSVERPTQLESTASMIPTPSGCSASWGTSRSSRHMPKSIPAGLASEPQRARLRR